MYPALPPRLPFADVRMSIECSSLVLSQMTGIPEDRVLYTLHHGTKHRLPDCPYADLTEIQTKSLLVALTVVCGPSVRLTHQTALSIIRYGLKGNTTTTLWLVDSPIGLAYGNHREFLALEREEVNRV